MSAMEAMELYYRKGVLDHDRMKIEMLDRCNVCDSTRLELVDPECSIARCRTCGYIFDNPRPTLEELIGFYSRPTQYDSWLSQMGPRQHLWERRLKVLKSTRNPGTLLDVGAGIGQFLAVARGSYSEVCGTEVSNTAIHLAKEKFDLNLLEGSVENIDMAGRTFDNVTLFHVLEHVPDPKAVLMRCHSILSRKGIVVIAVPNEVASLRGFLRKMLVKMGVKKQGRVGRFGLPGTSLEKDSVEVHLSHFTPKVLRQLLRSSGFSIVEESLDPYYVLTGLAKLKADIYYYACLWFWRLFTLNIYDTILMVARKDCCDSEKHPACGKP